MRQFVLQFFHRSCTFPTLVLFLIFIVNSCMAIAWHSGFFFLGGESIQNASVTCRNETASSSFSKVLQRFCCDMPRRGTWTDVATKNQSIHIKTESAKNCTTISLSQSLTDTVSRSSSSWFTNVTACMTRTLSWVAIFQIVDRLFKANDIDIATQVGSILFIQFRSRFLNIFFGIF